MSENKPPRLYKYLTSKRIDVLEAGMIAFTRPSALNDPFEHAAKLSGLYKATGQGLTAVTSNQGKPRNVLASLLGVGIRTLVSVGEQPLRHQGYGDKYAVLSLSERPDSLLMWAHYADEHRGFVIEFDTAHTFFDRRRPDDNLFHYLQKVNYVTERPILSLKEYSQALLFKSPHWDYEKEWRMVVPAEDANHNLEVAGRIVSLYAFPPECVSAVILGCRMSDDDRRKFIDLLMTDSRFEHVSLRFAQENPDHYVLRLGGEGRLHYLRALEAIEADDVQGVVHGLNLAIELEPENAEYHFLRGAFAALRAAHEHAGPTDARMQAARQDVEHAVDRNPFSARYWLFLHELCELQGDSDRGLEALGRAIECDPKDPELLIRRAKYLLGRGDFGGALRNAEQAVALDPESVEALFARASAHWKLGEFDAAKEDTDASIALAPDNAKLYQARSKLLERQGRLKLAEQDLSRALELEPENQYALSRRSRLRYEQGDLKSALVDVDRYLALRPDDEQAAEFRARLVAAKQR